MSLRATTIAAVFSVGASSALAHHHAVTSNGDACQIVIARATQLFSLGPHARPWCDVEEDAAPGFYVVGLHSGLPCPTRDGCSNLVGWYAVRVSNGRVIRWDVANERPGKPL